jgi:S-methylmethionine-dependent homocysteine/selenocysteine methylase
VNALSALLATKNVVFLDGAVGTELERRGVRLELPLWTALAATTHPGVLTQIHVDSLHAGADVVTANTFRTSPYTLRAAGRDPEARDLTRASVQCARDACARAGHGIVAGSVAPLEDCYSPQLVPADAVLDREHAAHVRNLADAGVDLLLVETMNTIREAVAAAQAAHASGLPVLVSFVLDPQGDGDLLSGENLEGAWAALGDLPAARLVNCAPYAVIDRAVARIAALGGDVPFGAYANAGKLDRHGRLTATELATPAEAAEHAATWHAMGARIIGGCCYTWPAHIRAIRDRLP